MERIEEQEVRFFDYRIKHIFRAKLKVYSRLPCGFYHVLYPGMIQYIDLPGFPARNARVEFMFLIPISVIWLHSSEYFFNKGRSPLISEAVLQRSSYFLFIMGLPADIKNVLPATPRTKSPSILIN